jgi:esterase/lipase superfamily enzyme
VLRAKDILTDVLLCKTDYRVESFQAMVKGTMKKDGAFGEFYSQSDATPMLEGKLIV